MIEVEYCILSFARVTVVDPSALRHLKNMQEKAKLSGCGILFCRAKHSVFDALVTAKLIESPDPDLVKYLRGEKWTLREKPTENDHEGQRVKGRKSVTLDMVEKETKRKTEPDAFA